MPALEELPDWWDEAIAEFVEHLTLCSFGGGMARSYWYWLADETCPRDHGDRCVVCGAEEVSRLCWWAGEFPTDRSYPGIEMWELVLCPTHVQQISGVILVEAQA